MYLPDRPAAAAWTLAAYAAAWVVVVQPHLDQISAQLHGVLLRLYEALPDASINTVVNLYNTTVAAVPGTQIWPSGSDGIQVAPVLAFAALACYVLVFLAVPALVTRRRCTIT